MRCGCTIKENEEVVPSVLSQDMDDDGWRSSRSPRVTLVSYARGPQYVASLEVMRRSPFFGRKLLFTDKELRADPLFKEHVRGFQRLDDLSRGARHPQGRRPFCGVVKPLMLAIGMRSSRPDDCAPEPTTAVTGQSVGLACGP